MAVWPLDSLIPLEEEEKSSNIPGVVFAGLVYIYIRYKSKTSNEYDIHDIRVKN